MSAFEILPWTIELENGCRHLKVPLLVRDQTHSLEFWFPEEMGEIEVADGLVALLLFSAMYQGLPLKVPEPVSPKLLSALPRLQEIAAQWFDEFRAVPVIAEARQTPVSRPPRKTVAAFTSGLDSLHTALRERDRLSELIYVQGYSPVEELDPDHFRPVHEHMKLSAELLGIPLKVIRTNFRTLEPLIAPWMDTHGSAIAAIGLFLAPTVDTFIIPSTIPWHIQQALGSNYLLDESWSTETVAIELEGNAFNRVYKTKYLVEKHPTLVPRLLVCWQFEATGLVTNCGRCEKCLRTMCSLSLLGWEDMSAFFKSPLNLNQVRELKLHQNGENHFNMWEAILDYGTTHAPEHPVHHATQEVMADLLFRRALTQLEQAQCDLTDSAGFQKLTRVVRDGLWASWSKRQSGWLRKKLQGVAQQEPAKTIQALWGKEAL
jgi:hypothetical protein